MTTKLKIPLYILWTIFILLLSPTSTFAVKQVSQEFSGDTLTYFPLTKGKAIIHVGEKFYTSLTPTVARHWEEKTLHSERKAFGSFVAVPFKQYSYVISGISTQEHYTGCCGDVSPITTEIWRLAQNNPQTFEKVLSLDAGQQSMQFTTLFMFRKALYATASNGDLWKTKNGTQWFKVDAVGYPQGSWVRVNNARVFDAQVYIAADYGIYHSKRGTTWHKLEGEYLENGNALVLEIEVFQDALYVVTVNSVVENTSIWKIWKQQNNKGWKKVFESGREIYAIKATENALYISKDSRSSIEEYPPVFSILKSKDGRRFRRIYNGEGVVDEMIAGEERKVLAFVNTPYQKVYLLRINERAHE